MPQHGTTQLRRPRCVSAVLLAGAALSGCTDALPPVDALPPIDARPPTDARPTLRTLPAAIVSDAVRDPADPHVPPRVYISLLPASVPNAQLAVVRSARTGEERVIPVTGGGFDPVTLSAGPGDTLDLTITVSGATAPQAYALVVPIERAPVMLRVDPPAGGRDVLPRATPSVVFSEPMDPGSVTKDRLRLLAGGVAVDGAPTVSADGLRATFQPRQALGGDTRYVLVVDARVTDRASTPLDREVSAAFTTAATVEDPPDTGAAARLAVPAFTMIEFQYPGLAGRWFYAPQVRVAETGGAGAAQVTRLRFAIPGLEEPVPTLCAPSIVVPTGAQVDLFRELYGDYEITFDNHDGSRATGADASVVMTYRDGTGRVDSVTATGAVAAGDLPVTYTGGTGHGYYTPLGTGCPQ